MASPWPKSDFKKDMMAEMAGSYDPAEVEKCWGDFWEKEGLMGADADTVLSDTSDTEKFVMVIPPPNVTGSLHLGHALTTAIEDCLTRWHRMLGHHTLWVPGTDHAGIATQAVVEKMIMKQEGKTRHDYGREAFIEKVWEWKKEYGNRITMQLRRLGGSVDWNREAFTMDANLSKAVQDPNSAIKKLPGHDPKNIKKYEFGVLHHFNYKFKDSDETITVATTRIETMLGDTAVAIHKDDERYTKYHGMTLVHPFFPEREVKLVLDDGELVDMSFGTGAVKITPAHDANDFKCGKKFGLDFIKIFTPDGKIAENGGPFAGMMRFDARNAITEELTKLGLYVKKEDNEMKVPVCSRSGDIIEPTLCPQWWVDCKDMAKRSTDAVRNKELELIPSFHNDTWFRWLDNIQDWCVSRQLWWGHRIPAYSVAIEGQEPMDPSTNDAWVSGRSEEEALQFAAEKFQVDKSKITLTQDEDVLDTWFSSALFPFSVFGWPDETKDMKAFYPTSLLETGHDILFFWVARMVMCGFGLTDQLPFTKVYLHAMVRDAHGRKMSKSLGNVLDPIDVMEGITLEELHQTLLKGNLKDEEIKKATEGQKKDYPDGIPKCGTDALRFGLLAYTQQGRDVNLNVNKVVAYRSFCNKMWNATKFVLMNIGAGFEPIPHFAEEKCADFLFVNRWILHKLNRCINECNDAMKSYKFASAVDACCQFWTKNDGSGCFCDLYVEMIKPIMQGDDGPEKDQCKQVLWTCLEVYLRLVHPMMPFVTEELYHRLPRKEGPGLIASKCFSIMIAPYPQDVAQWKSDEVEQQMGLLESIFRSIRSMRSSFKMTKERPQCFVKCGSAETKTLVAQETAIIATMASAGEIVVLGVDGVVADGCSKQTISGDLEVFMVPPAIDYADELKKTEKALAPKIKSVKQTKVKLGLAFEADAKSIKKMKDAAAEKMVAKYGLAAGSADEMKASLSKLLELEEAQAFTDPAYVAAMESASAAIRAKMPAAQIETQEKKLAELQKEVAAMKQTVEKCKTELAKGSS